MNNHFVYIRFKIINHNIDVFNYNEPFTKYLDDISNTISNKYYIVNHLYFNPTVIDTRK